MENIIITYYNNMIIRPTGGLCNRLRVVMSYYEDAIKKKEKLIVIWYQDINCNGNYTDYFCSLPNADFIYEKYKGKIDYHGYSALYRVTDYQRLKLLPTMIEFVNEKRKLLENNYMAIHVRRTDHIEVAKKRNRYTSDEDFFKFIDKYKKDVKYLYVAADNKETYEMFQKKYPKLILFPYHEEVKGSKRNTSLHDAVIDLYMCIFSKHFQFSGQSSFSDVILQIRKNQDINHLFD